MTIAYIKGMSNETKTREAQHMKINMSDVNDVVDRINRTLGKPMTAYSETTDCNGKKSYKANVGNFHLDSAYGGHGLVQMVNKDGGVAKIIGGFYSKREIYERMHAFLEGIAAKK
jgi:hypothetical protein